MMVVVIMVIRGPHILNSDSTPDASSKIKILL